MKKFYTLIFLFFSILSVFSQSKITLTFVGKDSLSQNLIALDSIFIKNLTMNCDTTLFDTVPSLKLSATWPIGIDEKNVNNSKAFIVKQNYPNPFQGNTFVSIYREYRGALNLMLFDGLGAKLAEYHNEFEKGFHSFVISSSGDKVLILMVFDDKNSRSIKIISAGQGNENNTIQYLGQTLNDEQSNLKNEDNTGFVLFFGNQMMFTAYAKGYNEQTIIDNLSSSRIYYYNMSLSNSLIVSTSTVTNITQATATCGGRVISDGGYGVTARGVCWNTSPNPTTADNHTTDGSGTGTFISYLTGLTANTTYYVRAYATNSEGTGYGNEMTFTTGQTINSPIVTTAAVTNITQTSATTGGTVSSDGGASVTVRGVCWSISPNPTIAGNHTSDGSGTGTFISDLTGLTSNTTYYVKAYATNSAGTGYGNELTFTAGQSITAPYVLTAAVTDITQTTATSGGDVASDGGATVTERGMCWSTSPNPTIAGSHTADGSGTGTFISDLTGLTPNTPYYVKAYATNSAGTGYGNEVTFTTGQPFTKPIVTTTTVTNITQTTAISGGTVTSDGGTPVTARGVCWSTSPNPTTTGSHSIDGSGMGTFVSNLTNLTGVTFYYVRAYAINSVGTSYGNELTFTTATFPTVTTATVTNITQTTAISGGTVTSDGGAAVTARGVCWSTSPNPTIAGSYTIDGTGTGTFESYLTNLTGATYYYVRAYATNSVGTSYGNELTFTTLTLPTVTTAAVTNITQTTATSGGTVTSDGGATVTIRGVCWSTSPNPVSTGSHTLDGSGTGTFISYLTNMTQNTLYYVRAYATNSAGTGYGNEISFTTGQTITTPIVTTTAVTNITQTTATSGGNVTSDGGATITVRGVCWSISPNPTTAASHTTDGSGTGIFVSNITGLSGGTFYYVRAYATNSAGTSYGNELTFTTATFPTVTTAEVTSITQTTATSGGTVTSDGGNPVTARGVCWSTSPTPTTAGSHTTDGSGTGTFVSNLTNLTGATSYYIRAYATNSVGTSYGNELTFTTLTLPTVTTAVMTNITQTTAISGGNISSDGGTPVIARGVCWSTSPNPTTAGNYTVDGSGTGTFVSNLTGLTGITTYYVRAYATNIIGTSYGDQQSFTTLTFPTVTTSVVTSITQTTAISGGTITSDGGATVTARGVCWSTSPNPTTAGSYTVDGSGTGTFVSNLTGLTGGASYYVRAYATNSVGISYGNQLTFTTLTFPTVTTAAVTNITQTTATSGGTVTSDGGATVTVRGVCWSTSPDPTTAGNHTIDGSGTGTFVSNLTGLTGITTYYVRAYATNSAGTSYGTQLTFTTLTLPTVATTAVTNITQTTATSGGNVTSDGGATVTARGVCWSTSSNPTTANSYTTDGSGTGTFVSSLTGLTANTLYYVRSYATNSAGTAYGNQVTFTTLANPVIPTVTTTAITNITPNTATSGGNVTSDGGATVTARGVCWSTSSNPTTANSKTTDGSGTGTFVSNLSGLTASTLYYVRAYATNSVGTAYGGEVSYTTLVWSCGFSININHVAGAVAPVSKAVTYGTVTNIPGEASKCWITSNLGADHQATSWDDASEPSAGWYWQFNRKRGYKHDGTTATPSWTIISINENLDWQVANDPCALELGSGWRIPTFTEWTNVQSVGNWTDYNGPWNSGLKLHAAGLVNGDGFLVYRGQIGYQWSSTQSTPDHSYYMEFGGTHCFLTTTSKTFGFSIRCINGVTSPIVITASVSNIGQNTATSGGNVTSDGGATVTARGVCWSTSSNPTTANSKTTDGSGTGIFVSSITSLTGGTLYYVRAYATNSVGTAYGNEVSFTTLSLWSCGSSFTINHVAGAVAPVTKTVTYGTVTNIPGETSKCWITSNLGANHQATAVDDATEASAGWYWQFNRKQGYKHDGTTRTPNTTWITTIDEPLDWQTANDPCSTEFGGGWRIPTNSEWNNVDATGSWTDWNGPWNSGLKLHAAGALNYGDGSLKYRGAGGYYWSAIQTGNGYGASLNFYNGGCYPNSDYKVWGFTLRCINNASTFTCGSSITINHVAGAVAPVAKTVTYSTVTNIPGETSKCWITSNLGADHQATAVNDATEASAGWYWQFNRMQGYKHDGTTRTPNTTWITSISENLDWQSANDPCTIELGAAWRIPTNTEWTNLDANGGWVDWNGPWNSGLKMHAAGYLNTYDGSLANRGLYGYYWSSIQQDAINGWYLGFYSLNSYVTSDYKANGWPLRCVRD